MFLLIRVTNLVQGERKNKFYLSFPSRSLISPQCHTEAKVIIKFTIHNSQFLSSALFYLQFSEPQPKFTTHILTAATPSYRSG